MDKKQYDLLMSEIDNIVAAVKKFPESAQGQACTGIITAFLSGTRTFERISGTQSIEAVTVPSAASASQAADGSEPHDLGWYADHYDLESINDMEFATFVAYYNCEAAPGDEKVETIDGSHLEAACEAVGRFVPTRPGQTLANAKSKKKYLQAKGSGKYTLSRLGRRYVLETILNAMNE